MKAPLTIRLLFTIYRFLWFCILPLLRLAPRLKVGWSERCLKVLPFAKVDIWIHAASVGEAYIARELLANFSRDKTFDILITTNTLQGRDVLERNPHNHGHQITISYMVFDSPALIKKAVAIADPKILVLIELEIWPALMAEIKRKQKQIIIVNGRMTKRSFKGYNRIPSLWRTLKPQQILAISVGDKSRLKRLFEVEECHQVPNIKFDRIPKCLISNTSSTKSKRLILASIRKQEEAKVIQIITGVLQLFPDIQIDLFPRHQYRVAHWQKHLLQQGISFTLKSAPSKTVSSVCICDTFGELINAYQDADAAFVGGSLAPLGGQNFIESFMNGTIAITGPWISDFLWVGDEVFSSDLVRRGRDTKEVLQLLIDLLNNPVQKEIIQEKANRYIEGKRGGGAITCQHIENLMHNSYSQEE